MIVEVCANSVESAMIAEKAGADRIEVCSELGLGGITPSYGILAEIRDKVSIPVHILIRPRSGHFTYSSIEFDVMLSDIDRCVEMGFKGVVSGVLNHDLSLDKTRTALLVERAGGLQFTFHRAFDWVKDPFETLVQLENMGVDNILTSGQGRSASEGKALLKQLHLRATKCTIIAAAGIRSEIASELKELGFSAIHLSGVKLSPYMDAPPKISMMSPGLFSEDAMVLSDQGVLEDVIKTVK